MGGTAARKVGGVRRIASRVRVTSNVGNSTMRAPSESAVVKHNVRPYAWKSGSTA
jgi:hypothetical protein